MLENFYPSVFEEFAVYLADFGWYFGWIIIVLKKLFWFIIFFTKRLKMKIKFFIFLFFLDPFLAMYLGSFMLFLNKKINKKLSQYSYDQ